MAERLCQCFAERFGRVQGVVDSLEEARHESARHGQMVTQEPLPAKVQIEHVADLLPVVDKLRGRLFTKARHAQHTLGEVHLEPFRFAEEDDRPVQDLSPIHTTETDEQLTYIARAGIVETLSTDRLFYGANDFRGIQVVKRDPLGGRSSQRLLEWACSSKRCLYVAFGMRRVVRPTRSCG